MHVYLYSYKYACIYLYSYKYVCIFVFVEIYMYICIHTNMRIYNSYKNLPVPACHWSEELPDCHKASQWGQPSTWT